MRHWFAGLLVLVLVAVFASPASAGKKYSYYRVGNPTDVVPNQGLQGGTVLMGGGTDVDAAFQWMCGRAAQGDFLVIRATGTDAYNPYVQQLCPGINSVATLIIPTLDGANDPAVAAIMRNAEAIWIAGGDQSNYVMWKGTAVQDELAVAIQRKAPLGGTSAGMMVLTQYIYAALTSQGVTSSQALADPYNKYMTLDRELVTIAPLAGAIGDSHFVTRDRMGRTLAFMARIGADGWSPSAPPKAIGVDEATAVLIPDKGSATVVGASAAYFLQAQGRPEVCAPKTPLTYLNVGVYRLRAGTGSFDLGLWKGTGGAGYKVSADTGALSSDPPGIY